MLTWPSPWSACTLVQTPTASGKLPQSQGHYQSHAFPRALSQLNSFTIAGSVSSSDQDRHSPGHRGVWMVEQGLAGQCDWRLRALDPSTEHTSLATGGINERPEQGGTAGSLPREGLALGGRRTFRMEMSEQEKAQSTLGKMGQWLAQKRMGWGLRGHHTNLS